MMILSCMYANILYGFIAQEISLKKLHAPLGLWKIETLSMKFFDKFYSLSSRVLNWF